MKARFTDEQIIAMIKEQEAGEKTADVCRRYGICSARFYKYNSKYGGMESPDANRQAVAHLCKKRSVSQRRACDVLQIDRSWMRYLSRRDNDAELSDAIKRVSRERRWLGYRRIHVMHGKVLP
mgnify:CR=1 FL=1